MKYLTSLLLLFTLSSQVMSQDKPLQDDFDYKNFIKFYQKAENYMKTGDTSNGKKFVKNAMYYMKKLVKKGFGDDIADQVAKLEQWQSGFDAQKANRLQMHDVESEIGNWASKFITLKQANPFSRCQYLWDNMKSFDRQKVLAMIQQFKASESFAKANDFTQQRTLELEGEIKDFDKVLAEVKFKEKVDKKITELEGTPIENFFDGDMRELVFYVKAYRQVDPQNQTLRAYTKRVDDMQANKGQILNQARSNQQKAAVVSELPVADVQDAALEADFMRVAGAASPSYKPTSTIITSRKWAVNNDITGRPVSRQRIAAITYRDNTGQCFLEHILFLQNYSGGGYGRTKIYSAYGKKAYDCSLK